jgi:hypothetical protein
MGLRVEVEIHMGGFAVQSVAQRAVGSPSNKQTMLSTLVHRARALCGVSVPKGHFQDRLCGLV